MPIASFSFVQRYERVDLSKSGGCIELPHDLWISILKKSSGSSSSNVAQKALVSHDWSIRDCAREATMDCFVFTSAQAFNWRGEFLFMSLLSQNLHCLILAAAKQCYDETEVLNCISCNA